MALASVAAGVADARAEVTAADAETLERVIVRQYVRLSKLRAIETGRQYF